MKTLLLTALLSINAFSQAERMGGTGNGGSGNEAQLAEKTKELILIQNKILKFFRSNPELVAKEFPEVTELVNARIEVVTEELRDKHDEVRTCRNLPEQQLIQCNLKELEKIKDSPEAMFVLMFHENLGLIGIEETSPRNAMKINGYKVSSKLANFVAKVSEYDLVANQGAQFGKANRLWTHTLTEKYIHKKDPKKNSEEISRHFINVNDNGTCTVYTSGPVMEVYECLASDHRIQIGQMIDAYNCTTKRKDIYQIQQQQSQGQDSTWSINFLKPHNSDVRQARSMVFLTNEQQFAPMYEDHEYRDSKIVFSETMEKTKIEGDIKKAIDYCR